MENVERNQKAKAGVTYCMVLEAGSERRKKPDMTTGEHVRVPCRGGDGGVDGGGYLARLRAIKSLLVYFVKCRREAEAAAAAAQEFGPRFNERKPLSYEINFAA